MVVKVYVSVEVICGLVPFSWAVIVSTPPFGSGVGAVYVIDTVPLLSAMKVFGVVLRVLVTAGLVSTAVAEPGVDAVLVRDRKTVALGMAVPVESCATTPKVTTSPAARVPDGAIGFTVQANDVSAEKAYESVLVTVAPVARSAAVRTSRPDVGNGCPVEAAGAGVYVTVTTPLPLAVNDCGDDVRVVAETAAEPPMAPVGWSPTEANESQMGAPATGAPAKLAVTVTVIGEAAGAKVPAGAIGLGLKVYLSTVPAAAECCVVPKAAPTTAASAATATTYL